MMRGFVAAMMGLALLCGAAARAEPQILRRGNYAEPDSLDPALIDNLWGANVVGDLFVGLTTEDADAKTIPGAAESWTVSADGLVWTFKLRPGLQWSDGTPLIAADFVFGFRHVLDPKTAGKQAALQYVIKNAEAANTGKVPVEQIGVRAVDDRTVEITLEAPVPYFTGLMSHNTAYPIPRHVFEKYGEAWTHEGRMVSNGPFKLALWRPHDQIRVVKNPLFYDAKNVRLDEVIFYPIEEETVGLNRFRAQEIDANLATRGFPATQLKWVRENLPGAAHVEINLANEYMVPNVRRPPFNDPRLRRAISLCLDRDIIADKVDQAGRAPANFFVPPGIANYHNTARLHFADWPMEQRREEARRLLAEAGYGPAHPLTFEYMHQTTPDIRHSVIAESAMLKQCGIIVRSLANEPKVHYSMVNAGDFTFAKVFWGADYNDPQDFLTLLDSRSGLSNYGGYKNPAFDALMDRAKVTLDLEKRADILAQAEQIALDDDAVIPLTFLSSLQLVASYVRGYAENPSSFHRSRWMWLERAPAQ